MREVDWTLLRGSAWLSIGSAVARVLGLTVSLLLAAVFSASDFGVIRYAIALASIVALGTQPFGQHVIARFVGKNRDDPERIDCSLSNAFFILPIVFVVSSAIAVPVLRYLGVFNIGIMAIFAGQTLFYTYWGLSSGFLEPRRLTVAYLGSNLCQIMLVFLLIQKLGFRSPTIALLVYGLSYILPLTLLGILWPLPGTLKRHLIRREIVAELLRFSIPVWISHSCYVLCSSLDLLVLQRVVSSAELGAYSLSKTLASVFLFMPEGISTLLMPKVAASAKRAHGEVLRRMLTASLLVNGATLIAYLPVVRPFTHRIFGADYLVGFSVSILVASCMIAGGMHSMISAVFVGSGRPGAESASRIMDLAATSLSCWFLIPGHRGLGAAVSMLIGKAVALLTYGMMHLKMSRLGGESLSYSPLAERK
jgi:O-antigen/teichoic acid export membrane protein